jgi:transcriptional regulator with XRE-family HTH domain
MDIKQKVGARIKQLRQEKKLSQEKLSHLCGLDRTYIASVERGKRNISIINLEKITKAVEISFSEFFEDKYFT